MSLSAGNTDDIGADMDATVQLTSAWVSDDIALTIVVSRHTTEIDVSALHDSSWVRAVTLLDINIHSKGLDTSLGRRLARTSIYRAFQINSYRKAYLLIKGGYAMRIDPFFSCLSESITGTKNIRSSIETEGIA